MLNRTVNQTLGIRLLIISPSSYSPLTDVVVRLACLELWCVWYGLERFDEDGEPFASLRVVTGQDRHRGGLRVNDTLLVLYLGHLTHAAQKNKQIKRVVKAY